MRTLLGALTTRGASFLAAGGAAVGCGFGLGETDLVRIGVLLLALPVLSAVAASRARFQVSCARRLVPARAAVGEPVEIRIRLSNPARWRTRLLLAEDDTPRQIGGQQRFVLDQLEPGGHHDLRYRIRPPVRGRFTIGPLRVRVADAFGLVEVGRSFSSRSVLVVTPPVVPLPSVGAVGGRRGDGGDGPGTGATTAVDDTALRAYQDGDDLRRVHWRSTARYGELMVRREERRWMEGVCLFLDTRRRVHVGSGSASSFEVAVSAVASIGVHLAARGTVLQLVTDTGQVIGSLGPDAGSTVEALLDMLAVLRPSPGVDLTRGVTVLDRAGFGTIIAVSGRLSVGDATRLALAGRRSGPAMALLTVPGSGRFDASPTGADPPAGSQEAGEAVDRPDEAPHAGDGIRMRRGDAVGTGESVLAAAGWRVTRIAHPADLAAAWRSLHTPVRSFPHAAAATGWGRPAAGGGRHDPQRDPTSRGHAGTSGTAASGPRPPGAGADR